MMTQRCRCEIRSDYEKASGQEIGAVERSSDSSASSLFCVLAGG